MAGRVAIGKAVGLAFGLLSLLFLPLIQGDNILFGIGILVISVLMGATVGMLGVFDEHPVFDFKMSWCVRGALVGLLFGLAVVLLGYDQLETILSSHIFQNLGLKSPFWAIVDFVFLGMLIDYLATKFAGQGENLPAD